MLRLEELWYRPTLSIVTILLMPLAVIFYLLIRIRLFLYQIKVIESVQFSVPVIVVGNITIGGTGKTPFVIWLAHLLKKQGFKPGIVSRGVGSKYKIKQPQFVDIQSRPEEVGDESILIRRSTDCPVVICVDRVAAVHLLLTNSNCNIVITDDGLQHYRLGRSLEIAMVDETRQFGNGKLLPAGPLREPRSRLKKVDFLIKQGSQESFVSNRSDMYLTGTHLVSLGTQKKVPVSDFKDQMIHAVAAIGNPHRFFLFLKNSGMKLITHPFQDHYLFTQKDFFFNDEYPIIMTEKDAVKCRSFATDRMWYLPVEARVNAELEQKLLNKIAAISLLKIGTKAL